MRFKFLDNQSEDGFTLIELLVVIVIIGILAAIALPSFLNQASKARQAEAKQTLGALTRGQQAFRLENTRFAENVASLGLGVETSTNNYLYVPDFAGTDTNEGEFKFVGVDFSDGAQIYAKASDGRSIKDYLGATVITADEGGNAATTTIVCESKQTNSRTDFAEPTVTYLPDATLNASEADGAPLECASESTPLGG